MNVMNEAYITGIGAYLPGDPVDNEQLAARFGPDTARGAELRKRALAANGIKTRHYAVDDKGMTMMLNEELAVQAVGRALADRGLPPQSVRMLATGSRARPSRVHERRTGRRSRGAGRNHLARPA
jgi:3-oxoacyl-[acyl-carrier-protein] synthase III